MTGKTGEVLFARAIAYAPQWSPVVMTGKTVEVHTGHRELLLPQWSPVVMTGKTDAVVLHRSDGLHAAMEPRRDDGEDVLASMVPADITGTAAMEPRRDDGEDASSELCDPRDIAAAMEPRRDDGEDHWVSVSRVFGSVPQWSPVVMTGKTAPGTSPKPS